MTELRDSEIDRVLDDISNIEVCSETSDGPAVENQPESSYTEFEDLFDNNLPSTASTSAEISQPKPNLRKKLTGPEKAKLITCNKKALNFSKMIPILIQIILLKTILLQSVWHVCLDVSRILPQSVFSVAKRLFKVDLHNVISVLQKHLSTIHKIME
ncbi:hypothetical protein J6590_087634 [Homalodisca vitripennis]|nr:hypothetical protein J6590_087634 [Homalodisca vitripennis]